MSVAITSHFNIVERIDDDDDGATASAAASTEMMWMTMPLPEIRLVLSYYCANHVQRRCLYPFLTAADNDRLDFLVHQLIFSPHHMQIQSNYIASELILFVFVVVVEVKS